MTTAESNTRASTLIEFRESLQAVVDDARKAGISWNDVVDELAIELAESRAKRDVEKNR